MKTFETISNLTYLDILFLNKNKSYGSYVLRKDYGINALKALLIVVISIVGLCFMQYFKAESNDVAYNNTIEQNDSDTLLTVNVKQLKEENSIVQKNVSGLIEQPEAIKGTYKNDIPTVVENQLATNILNPLPEDLETKVAGKENTIGSDASNAIDPSLIGDGNGSILGSDQETTLGDETGHIAEINDNVVYSKVTLKAKPNYDINGFVSKNLVYPEVDRSAGNEGRVYISFIVELDGSISNVNLDGKSPSATLTHAAIQVIKKMPKWSPAQLNGKPVRSYYRYPIRFKLGI